MCSVERVYWALSHDSSLDWVGMIREGIPAAAVESVLSAVHVSQSELAQALGIPERTLARRKREGVLNSEESSKLLRLARVMSRASEVFDGPAAAIDWLKSPNAALRGNAPLTSARYRYRRRKRARYPGAH